MDSKEQKLIAKLYEQYVDKIYKFIYFKTHHKETAEDLTSQTFFKALEKIGDYDSKKGQFSSWLYRIAQNTVVDYYRSRKETVDISDVWDLTAKGDIVRDSEFREQLEKIAKYLAEFSGEQREIIVMRVWDELSYKEIAEIVGKNESNCKMIFSRAINKLRKEEIFALVVLMTLIKII